MNHKKNTNSELGYSVDKLKKDTQNVIGGIADGNVDPNAICGTLQDEVKSPRPGGIRSIMARHGRASVMVPQTSAVGKYDASAIFMFGFQDGSVLGFYVDANYQDKWRICTIAALYQQPSLKGGVLTP